MGPAAKTAERKKKLAIVSAYHDIQETADRKACSEYEYPDCHTGLEAQAVFGVPRLRAAIDAE